MAIAGEEVRARFDRTGSEHGVDARAVGPPSRLELVFGPSSQDAADGFVAGMAAARVVPSLAMVVSAASGDAELRPTEDAFSPAFEHAAGGRGGLRPQL